MEQMNFHKQKLYALIAAGIALVSLLLPWLTFSFLGESRSWNGFRGWGLLSFIGILGVGALTFMGNKAENYTAEYKKYVMIAFGAIALGAVLFFLRKTSVVGGGLLDDSDIIKTGFGLWICLVAGLAGLAMTYGLIKIEDKKPTPTSQP
jgi:hypothetical protein